MRMQEMDHQVHNQLETSEDSSSSVVSDTVIEVKSTNTIDSKENSSPSHYVIDLILETESCTGRDASTREITESSSTPVASDTIIEVRCEESENVAVKDGDSKEICENSVNLIALETSTEVRSCQSGCGTHEIADTKSNLLEKSKVSGEKLKVKNPEPERETGVITKAKCSSGELNSGNWDGEKVCRICHLASDRQSDVSDLIQLGCVCKDELGIAHRPCAEVWFKLKGSRSCEICGETAKNITGVGDNRFMEEWNESMLGHSSSSYSGRARCWRDQPFCNILMACLVIAFILPWFFRVNMF